MYHYINEDVKINFPLPKLMVNTIKEAEELDLQNDPEYFCVAEAIDILAKQYVANGLWDKSQWDLICKKYPCG